MIHYPIPPHLQECYKNLKYKKGDYPIAERLAGEVLSLPMHVGMCIEDIQELILPHFKI